MNNQKYLLFSYLILFLVGCRSESPSSNPKEAPATTASLDCDFDSINLQHGLYLRIDHLEIKLADLPTCENIPVSDYKNHQIPVNAKSAAMSWHAGAYFFLTQNEKTVRIHRALRDEKQDGPLLFLLYAIYEDGKFSFQPGE